MDDLGRQREQMVERQIARRGVRDPHVLRAMREVPREEFVSRSLREVAYRDSPLPIGAGQTISQPYIVALMIDAAQLKPGDRVLEIGAGSGYAAAVMSRIAGQVHAIERHDELAGEARRRFERLGYDNIELRHGDGSGGWPEAAPFDAILAAAGGPGVPEVLRSQLAVGGRLVMPVGSRTGGQRLVKLTRVGNDRYEQEELGGVMFVPLIGEHGWKEDGASAPMPEPSPTPRGHAPRDTPTPELIAGAMEPLPGFEDPAFGALFDRFAGARVVLLGEASHGTSEFYRARDAITRRLVEKHGYTIVAVEADWPDAAAINRHVRGQPRRQPMRPVFTRFPTWMWRNAEVSALVDWLRRHNTSTDRQAGFYGLDLYSLNSSIEAVIGYLQGVDPEAAEVARRRYSCFAPWAADPAQYGRMAITEGFGRCEGPVLENLRELLDRQVEYARADGEHWFDATQNARLVRNAEAYYRAMYYGAAESWNLRDTHMFETLQALLHAHDDARAVVWAHNSHIGDARHTEMGRVRDELNLGQLCREHYGDEAVLIGFGTHAGTVAAADDWGEPMQVMDVQPSREDSVENLFHHAGVDRGLLELRGGRHPVLRERLGAERLERFIGVVYRPDSERWSHYAAASLAQQFDAWVWFERTRAVQALPTRPAAGEAETWPFGV